MKASCKTAFLSIMMVAILTWAMPLCANPMHGQSRVDGEGSMSSGEPPWAKLGKKQKPRNSSEEQRPRNSLTEAKHQEFMNNEAYAEADSLLNATWSLMKTNLSNAEYRELQSSQRQWINSGREKEAAEFMDQYPPAEAYAKAIRRRADMLAADISTRPRNGSFQAAESEFAAKVNGTTISIEGNAFHGQNLCDYDGVGKITRGWITMRHDDLPDFYLLFTRNGATIFYDESGMSQGCGMGVEFKDDYVAK